MLSLLLAVTTIALYSPIARAPFLNYDDAIHVTDNPHVRAGLTWNTAKWAFRTSETSDWHPITWLSHALDCQLFGVDPSGPHTVNFLLHAVNAVLLFLILETATGFLWRSFAVAALFALHPINVESVAWISERKDVLSMLFFLLALAAYGWYVKRPGMGRYLAVTVAYVLALMSKAQVITFPFALLLLDYWPLYRLAPGDIATEEERSVVVRPKSIGSLILEKVPWFALSAISAVITMKVEADATQAKLPLWVHLANAALSYVQYLGKTFWPAHLAPVYPHPGFAIDVPAAIISTVVLVAVSALAWFYRRKRPFFVGWFWFLGTLVPMIGLVQISVHSMADRYAYIPLMGIFVIISWGAAALVQRWDLAPPMPIAASALVLIALAFSLHRQLDYWRDNVTLWSHTLAITTGNYTAEDNLATALLAQGKIDEAIPHLQRARSLRPDDIMATINLATYDQMRGDYAAAIEGYAKIPKFTRNPSFIETAHLNSGYAHLSLKQYDNARQEFEAALRVRPENPAAYRGLGLAAQKAGNLSQAIQNYQRSVDLQPTPVGYLLVAQALELNGQPDAAKGAESQAARISPNVNDDVTAMKQLLGQ